MFIVIFLILSSCSSPKNLTDYNFNFSEDMDMDTFTTKLMDYAENKPYPNINN